MNADKRTAPEVADLGSRNLDIGRKGIIWSVFGGSGKSDRTESP